MKQQRTTRLSAAGLVWTIWGSMIVAGLGLVQRYGFRMPYSDEWGMFDVLMGRQPLTLAWLWTPLNEHRMLLPRLVYLGLTWASNYRFHAGAYVSFLLLGAAAAALMLTARRLRGSTSLADAFFAFLLLNWGPVTNLPWGFQVCFALPSIFVTLALVAIVRCKDEVRLGTVAAIVACLLGAALCGAFSLPFLPPVGCWFLYAAMGRWRARRAAPHARRDALAMTAGAVALLGFAVVYFVGFVRPAHHVASPGLWASFCTALEFLTNSLGRFGRETWPVSGVLFFVFCVASLSQLVWVFWRQPHERLRAAGLLCWYAGMVILAAGLGAGRAFMGSKIGFTDRYMTLVAPFLALAFLQAILYCGPLAQRRIQAVFCVLLGALAMLEFYKAPLALADYEGLPSLEADMRLGMPPQSLAMRYAHRLAFGPADLFVQRLETLRDARIGPYRGWNATQRANDLSITLLRPIDAQAEPADTVVLMPGQSYIQRFSSPEAAGLYRLDIQILPKYVRRPGVLVWSLAGVAADRTRFRMSGRTAGKAALAGDCLVLRLPRMALHGPTDFTLTLSYPSDAPPKNCVGFATFPVADAPGETTLRGYAFFDRQQFSVEGSSR